MAARLRATSAPGPSHLIPDCLGLALCCVIATVAGCASGNATVQGPIASATPSFMLSDQQKAERNLKDPAALHLAYGHFEEQIGQPGDARKSYEKALGENPKSVEAVLGIARLDQLADKPKEAEAGFQRALAMKPGDPVVLAACGQFYASQNRWPQALQHLNAAIAAAPKVPTYKHLLAVAETRAGDINAGVAIFSQLVGPEKAHYNVAYLLAKEGKQGAAFEQCQAALAINPKFEPARAMLDQLRSQQVAGDSRGMSGQTASGQPRSAGTGFGPPASTGANQPASTATQVSWQAGASSSNGMGGATRAAATLDPALPKTGASGAPQLPDYSSSPWADSPAPPK
jgi:Flp pilus assembly protein TadD